MAIETTTTSVKVPSKDLQQKTAAVNGNTVKSDNAYDRINRNSTISTVLKNAGTAATTVVVTTIAAAPLLAKDAKTGGVVKAVSKNPFLKAGTKTATAGALKVAGTVAKRIGPWGLAAGIALDVAGNYFGNKAASELANMNATDKDPKKSQNFPPPSFDYNLPPHEWSLPIRASEVDVFTKKGDKSPNVDKDYVIDPLHPNDVNHRFRRGVIWHWDDGSYVSAEDQGEIKTAAEIQKGIKDDKNAGKYQTGIANNYNFGFQFLWNPETISQSIARNMTVTPSSADRFRSVAGAFPGQETFQFSITIDRVNDFACLRSLIGKGRLPGDPKNQFFSTDRNTVYFPDTSIPTGFLKYYKHGLGTATEQKLKELTRFGTMADLEYLFKCLNGTGQNTAVSGWTTLLNKPTSNTGFLSPTLIACRLGPDSTSNLSFVGWITNLSINHTYFTEDMIPLRTVVTFNCDAFAGSTIV